MSSRRDNILSWLYASSTFADDFNYSDLPMPQNYNMNSQRVKSSHPTIRRFPVLSQRRLPSTQTQNEVAKLETQYKLLSKENEKQNQELDYMFEVFLSALQKSSLNDISHVVQEIYSSLQLPTQLHMEAEELLQRILSEGRRLQWEKAEKEARHPELIRKTRNLLIKSLRKKMKSPPIQKKPRVASLQDTDPFFTQDESIAHEVDYFFDSFMSALQKSSVEDVSHIVQEVYSNSSTPTVLTLGSEEILENLLSDSREMQWEKAEKKARHPELIRKTRQLLKTSLKKKRKQQVRASNRLGPWHVLLKELWEVATDTHPMMGDHLVDSIVEQALKMRKIKAKL